jgi:sulfide dehydrogenase cytochrome subunit
MIMVITLLLIFPMSFFAFPVVAADSSTAPGAAFVHACAACHGPEGQSQGAIPSFHTLPKERLVEALRAFRSDKRQGTVMNRIAKGLEDADIEAIAVYMSRPRD